MSKALQFTAPKPDTEDFDAEYEYRLLLNDAIPLHVFGPGDRIEVKRVKKPKPLTSDMIVEMIAEQLMRDGEIKDGDELAAKILEFQRKRMDSPGI